MRSAVLEQRAGAALAGEKVAAEKRQAAEEERQRQALDAKSIAEQNIRDLAEKRDIIMQVWGDGVQGREERQGRRHAGVSQVLSLTRIAW